MSDDPKHVNVTRGPDGEIVVQVKQTAIDAIEHSPSLHDRIVAVLILANFPARDSAWRALINQSWAKDWSDPREDIYTLEDGKPSHEPR